MSSGTLVLKAGNVSSLCPWLSIKVSLLRGRSFWLDVGQYRINVNNRTIRTTVKSTNWISYRTQHRYISTSICVRIASTRLKPWLITIVIGYSCSVFRVASELKRLAWRGRCTLVLYLGCSQLLNHFLLLADDFRVLWDHSSQCLNAIVGFFQADSNFRVTFGTRYGHVRAILFQMCLEFSTSVKQCLFF